MKFRHFAVFIGALVLTLVAIEKSKENSENTKSDNAPSVKIKKDVKVEEIKKVKVEKPITQKPKVSKKKVEKKEVELSKRQQDILKLFAKREKLDAPILEKNFSDVTLRTIRRDLDSLEKSGLVKKIGRTKGAYYVKL